MDEQPQVWLYYWVHRGRYAHAYPDLTTAMIEAGTMLDNEEGAVETIVDTDGTEYEGWQAVRDWIEAYRKGQNAPEEAASADDEPAQVREFRGQRWLVTE